jgi:hypothetical protein
MVLGIRPEWFASIGPHRKRERVVANEDPSHAALFLVRDLKLIGMLTGAALDCGPHYISSSPAFGWSETTV